MTTLTVSRNGTAIPGVSVAYPVQVSHGRSSITDGPTSGSARVVLYSPDGSPPQLEISDTLQVTAYGLARCTGIVSDLEPVQDADTGRAYLTVTITGTLAELALTPVTPDAWPAETSEARANRILAAASVPAYSASGELNVLPLTGDESTALDLLGSLATDTGAAVVDSPSGTIIFQDLLARAQRYRRDTWAQMLGTWAAQTDTWANQMSMAVSEPVLLPGSATEWHPAIAQHRGNIVNRVTVEYGEPVASVTLSDTDSQNKHRIRHGAIKTALATVDDATARATSILKRLGLPRYEMGSVTVLVHKLDTATRAKVLNLTTGDRVVVQDLPASFPMGQFLGVVEGWAETYTWNQALSVEEHRITLALSDPRASFASMQWLEVPGGITWASVPSGRIWADMTTPEALAA